MINRLRDAPPPWPEQSGPTASRHTGVPFDTLVLNSSSGSSDAAEPELAAASIANSELHAESVQARVAASEDVLHFEVRRQGAGRSTETVSVPWQLLAHMMLSQQGQLVAPGVVSQPAAPGSKPTGVLGMQQANQVAMALAAAELMSSDHSAPAASVPLLSSMRTRPSTEASAPDRPSPNASAVAPWALRLIRWASEHASENVLWLRDYTIDDTAAAGLMKMLQAFGQAHGVHVTRLMFNGRELWRAPHSSV